MKLTNKIASLILLSALFGNSIASAQDDFTLLSVTDDSQFTLSEARGKYVALHFLLKTECPVCIRHTHSYINNADQLPNVEQVFIKPDTDEEIAAWAEGLDEGEVEVFPIYRDPDAELAKKYEIPDGYEFHGQVVHYPALILLDPEGKEVFRYVGKSNRERYSFEQLQAKMKELED